ncbi:hypothetical protein ACFXDE_02085 [Kitasatospora sp. NPDC059408]|uniref:hypothetical protein n=1 Tax=Kitasatospora sp. NPDC059408 TaxID=3346823 RepID=UPI003675D44D
MTTPDDEFTELRDATIPRVDLVDKAANGTRFLIAKAAEPQGRGLMDPGFVRDLIGKTAGPEPDTAQEQVTVTGSPGAIAKMIHTAALRARDSRDDAHVAKAKYDADDLKNMAADGQAMKDQSYPIADHEDLDRAIRAIGRGGADHDAIRRHVITRAKALGATSEIPDNWAADGSLKEVSKMIGGDPDEGVDGLDPTVVLAAPDDDASGDVNEPGSPAWEAIDAATAQKWTSIAVRLRNALGVMAERELLEAASADPDDAEAAWDLQDAQFALDYVIDTLASFAVGEQAEAELCGEAMAQVGKALDGFDPAALDTVEALGQVAKAGRVLSAANENAIRTAAEHLQKVLASLPEAPVAKTANEEPAMPTPTPSEDRTAASGQEPAMGIAEPAAGAEPLAKADGEKPAVVVVYDQKGRLIGIVDPSDVTPVANAEAGPDDMDGDDSDATDDSSADDDTPDLEPQPAAEAGTPTNAPDDEAVTKTTPDDGTTFPEMFKSSLLAAVEDVVTKHSATQADQIAKTGDAVLELADLVETLKGRVTVLEEQPAAPKVFTNGATPPAEHLRGQDHGAPAAVDVAKARELKGVLYRGTAAEQNRAATDMQTAAIAALQAIHQR